MKRNQKVQKILVKHEVPDFLKNEFGLDERTSIALVESVDIQSLSMPESKKIDVRVLEPEENSGITDDDGNDAHGTTKKVVLVKAKDDEFAFVIQHHRKESSEHWKVTGEKV